MDGGRSPQHIAQLVAAQLNCPDQADAVGQAGVHLQEGKVAHSSEDPYNHSVVTVVRFLSPSAGCMDYQVTGSPFEQTQVLAHLADHWADHCIVIRQDAQPLKS